MTEVEIEAETMAIATEEETDRGIDEEAQATIEGAAAVETEAGTKNPKRIPILRKGRKYNV